MAQALNMGDEVHNRNAAATALLFKRLAPGADRGDVARATRGRGARLHRGQRSLLPQPVDGGVQGDARRRARTCRGSSLVTAMARNGVNFGIRLAGTGDAWFEAPANPVDGLYFPGYSIADAAADLGDSAITETAGRRRLRDGRRAGDRQVRRRHVGRRACTTACACGRSRSAPTRRSRCRRSTSRAAAAGIDARKVVDRGMLPVINSGIAHREAGRRADRRRRHDGAADGQCFAALRVQQALGRRTRTRRLAGSGTA